jgi:hypothetical protein
MTSDTKYTGNCSFAILPSLVVYFWMTKATLTAECVAEMYKMRGCPCSKLESVGRCLSVAPSFKIKTRCSSHICPRSSCHTYGQNINTENQCLKYINFITRILSLHIRLYRLSHWATAEQSNSTDNRPGATHASRRSLRHRSPTHLHLLSSVKARVSRLTVATQQVKGKHNNIYASSKQTKVLLQKATYT